MTKTSSLPVLLAAAIALCAILSHGENAMAASKSARCDAYARNAARSAPTRGGPVRGAVAGGAIGSFGGNWGAGAAVGAGVGATRRVAQRSRSYRYYYDHCMAH